MPKAGTKLLVVEDEPEIANALATYARMRGYEVAVADNGHDAVTLGESFAPDAVLLDIALPGMDGRDVLMKWNEKGTMSEAVVVFLTARDEQSDRVLGLELGADEYETKPLQFQMLFNKLERLIEKKRGGR